MPETSMPSAARESIIKTAMNLFYENGYKATGINEVISESKIAKATFYSHFPSKELLCLEVLRRRHEGEMAQVITHVESKKTPLGRFLAPIEFIGPWLEGNNFRGCAFLNMASEEPNEASAIRTEGRRHYEQLRLLLSDLSSALIASDPARYNRLEPRRLSDTYLTEMTGAIALTQIYSDLWPVRHASKQIRALIAKPQS